MATDGTGKRSLTPRQHRALSALALGEAPDVAASRANCSKTTIYRWLKDPVFTGELRRLEGESLRHLARRVMGLSDQAADALARALDPDMPINAQLRAASIICERGPALSELTAILERLDVLEAAIHERQN